MSEASSVVKNSALGKRKATPASTAANASTVKSQKIDNNIIASN